MSLLLLRSLPAGAFHARHSQSSHPPFISAFRKIKSNPIASLQRRTIFSISASATSASETISISAHKHPPPPSSEANPAALEWVNRTAFCGELSEPDVGKRVSDVFRGSTFKVFVDTLSIGGIIKALCVPSGAKYYSNTALKKGYIYFEAIKSGAKGLPFLKVSSDGSLEGIPALVSSLDLAKQECLPKLLSTNSDDLILFAIGKPTSVNKILDRLRIHVANELCIGHARHSILWVTDFPMFEWNDSKERFEALHHPFTAPNPEDMKDISYARALGYDLVYNGVEIGGGSLRIYKRDLQEKVLEIFGISSEQGCYYSFPQDDHCPVPLLTPLRR